MTGPYREQGRPGVHPTPASLWWRVLVWACLPAVLLLTMAGAYSEVFSGLCEAVRRGADNVCSRWDRLREKVYR